MRTPSAWVSFLLTSSATPGAPPKRYTPSTRVSASCINGTTRSEPETFSGRGVSKRRSPNERLPIGQAKVGARVRPAEVGVALCLDHVIDVRGENGTLLAFDQGSNSVERFCEGDSVDV